ncbi:MAG: EAL domain-containing protein [Acidobacteriota bacterium]|nr:EAL domain-containing protein [Acidobacteriota bacterium]
MSNSETGIVSRPRSAATATAEAPLPVGRWIAIVVGLFLVVIVALVAVGAYGLDVLAGLQSFVSAESHWAKGQKDASLALSRYLDTGDESDYRRFVGRLGVTLGDRKARLALELPRPDLAAAQQGFLEGRNGGANVDEMTRFYLRFHGIPIFSRAVEVWERGDLLVAEMLDLGARIHGHTLPLPREVHAGFAKEIDRLNERATIIEDAFSATVLQATRWVRSRLVAAILAMTLLLGALAVAASALIARLLRRRDEALRSSEQRFRLLFERNLAGLFRTTLDGRILDCNSAFARILGYPAREDVLKVSALDLYADPSDRDSFLARLARQRVLINFELNLKRRDGTTVWVLANESLLEPEGGGEAVMEGSLIDITDRKHAEHQRWHQANHDALTDLPNRVLFNDRLSLAILHAQRRRQSLAVMFLDLDHFKRVNDTLGHSAGDELLVKAADRLRCCIRADDTVARVGGDEFLLLLNGIGREADAATMARKILQVVSEPYLIQNRELFVEASIGIGLYPGDGEDAEKLVANVDTAMYRAKETGRNSFQFFTQKMQEQSQERAAMESGLRRALPRGEFVLHYQPILHLATRVPIGVEALVRWRHPEKGILSPREFIPLAEDIGLITRVGEWVLRRSCEQLVAWYARGASSLRMSVNVSARQFHQKDFAASVRRIVEESGLAPDFLELEITESIAMQDVIHTGRILSELNDLGVHISMDDFGTGHSSLNYLKHFPIRRLKIDQSFVAGMAHDEKDKAIVATIISIAGNLGLGVTAEGVETEEQAALLLGMGCADVQGFLFGRPVAAEELEVTLGLGAAAPGFESVRPSKSAT